VFTKNWQYKNGISLEQNNIFSATKISLLSLLCPAWLLRKCLPKIPAQYEDISQEEPTSGEKQIRKKYLLTQKQAAAVFLLLLLSSFCCF